MHNIKSFACSLGLVLISISGYSQSSGNTVYKKLFAELGKYAVVYDKYNDANYPILSGNAAIGGLMDPLGRGVYNIEVNDLYLNEKERCIGPGMMLYIAQFAGLQPKEYRQSYNLENGILSTHIAYSTGAYNSELFFSQDDKELMVYTLTNLGKDDLLCNIDLGRYSLKFASQNRSSLYLTSPDGSFSCLHYFLQSNMNLNTHLPYSQDVYVNVPPGKTVELTLRLKVHSDNTPKALNNPTDVNFLLKNHINKWQENWKSMGFVILPEGEYAKTFYRSLHWLQCTAGLERNLPGEQQFATVTSNMAAAYNYHGKVRLDHSPWWQEPFTYGGAGWSILAYTWFGDKTRAGNMLAGLYRPEVLKKNVTDMFPVGKYEFEYAGKKRGKFEYLSQDNDDAIAFAHENLFDRSNRQVPPFDTQVHIQGFAPAMYYHYNRLYAEKEDTAYAVMRGSARFWQSILHWDAKQKSYTVAPLLSLTEDLFEADLLDALIAAKWVLTQAATLAEQRNTDSDLRKKWLQIAQNIRIKDRNDVYLEFGGDDGSRAGAGYQGIRGYAYLGFPTLETMKSFAARKVNKSLNLCWERNKKGEGMITFIANWFALTDAYWGRAEEAYAKSLYSLTQTEPSTGAMCEQNGVMYYFLTSYASFTMIPVSMVLQSAGNDIKVFPAVPEAFKDIEFYNLPATGNIRVSGIMKGGKTQKVWFEKEGKIVLEIKDKDRINVSVVDGRLKETKK
ncbi:hypothetical protein FACS1894177_03310 [Bacteroidia bacterium]|nr:hypothetical protein FACS1894177_03310 [Bacteroidia bacterium]